MKKFFMQLGQRILKYKKKLIYGALALFIGQICFFGLGGIGVQNEVFADEGESIEKVGDKKVAEKLTMMQIFHKIVYICIYPVLIIAGKVVDNSLVYGEVFGFDAVLWQLWVIVRNIANFGLGFIFIYKIFEFLIKGQKGDDIKKLLVSSLIAGIGIQASWFLMAALIDVSTIVTYGVGGLPMTVLKTDEKSLEYNPYILGNALYMETDKLDDYHMYLTNQTFVSEGVAPKFISECETFDYKVGDYTEELILAPKMIHYTDVSITNSTQTYYPTQKTMCHIGDEVYHFSELYDGLVWKDVNNSMLSGEVKEGQNTYTTSVNTSITALKSKGESDIQQYIEQGRILQIGDAHTSGGVVSNLWTVTYSGDKTRGLDVNNKWIGSGPLSGGWNLRNLGDVLSGNYAGVFSALYGSLMNAGMNLRLTSTSDNGQYVKLLNIAFSLGDMIAIAIPLLVMVVVLVMRIGVLWMIIILSPVVVLLRAFGFDKKIGEKNKIFGFMQLDKLLGVVFAPVVICFAVSMSTVLVRIISAMNRVKIATGQQDILGGLVRLNIAGVGVNIGKLVGSVIGIAITWFLMWAAVKSSELGKTGIVDSIEHLSKSALASMPVIPVPGKEGEYLGVGSVFGSKRTGQKGIISTVGDEIKSKYTNDSNDTLKQRLDIDNAREEAEKARYSSYSEGLFARGINDIAGKDWRDIPIMIGKPGEKQEPVTFYDNTYLNDGQREEIINSINSKDKDVRRLYGANAKEIKIGDKTWKFVEQEEKKDEKGQVIKDKNGKPIMEDKYQYVQQKND